MLQQNLVQNNTVYPHPFALSMKCLHPIHPNIVQCILEISLVTPIHTIFMVHHLMNYLVLSMDFILGTHHCMDHLPSLGMKLHRTIMGRRKDHTPPNMHSTPPSSGLHPSLSTRPTGEIPSFDVCFCTGNISVCNDCRNKFDRLAIPPHNLVVRQRMEVF